MYKLTGDAELDGRVKKGYCNFIAAVVEGCGKNLVRECIAEEEVADLKETRLKELHKSVEMWDTANCTPVK